jgi:hypothetical protein
VRRGPSGFAGRSITTSLVIAAGTAGDASFIFSGALR